MKRILMALAVLLTVQVANAQFNVESAQKAVEKAKLATENPKKSGKAATWLSLAKAYMKAYDAATGPGLLGSHKTQISMLMGGVNPASVENVELDGSPFTKENYGCVDYFFNADGLLAMMHVTKPAVENALEGALGAYVKALELDPSKVKEVTEGLQSIVQKYATDAETEYNLGNDALSSVYFEKAAEVSGTAPLNNFDGMFLSNAALTAQRANDMARAQQLYEKCIENEYYGEGDVVLRLAMLYGNNGDKAAQKQILELGFAKLPDNKDILLNLIEYYQRNDEDPAKLFDLIAVAKQTDTTNPYPYYAEGLTYEQLSKADLAKADEYIAKAAAAFDACSTVDPNYEWGYVGKGQLYYNRAVVLQELASAELDDAKWVKLNKQLVESLKNAIEPMEKAYEISQNNEIKMYAADLLKTIYYRFVTESPEYEAKYNKYNEIVKSGQPM